MSIHFYERLQAGGAQKRCAYYKEIDDGDIISTSALGSDLICTMLMLAVTAYNILICEWCKFDVAENVQPRHAVPVHVE